MLQRAQVSIQPWRDKMFQPVVVPLPSQSELKLSASSIERYISCPFQYFAERMLKLKDAAIVDLDPDRRNIGSISHSYLEKITMNFSNLVTLLLDRKELEKELEAILENLKTEQQLLFVDLQVWSGIKKRLIATGVRFLEFEKQWSLQFPNSKIKETEKAFKWVKDNCVIQGKIDRIDMDNQGNTVVIDYKSGVSSFKTYSGWIEHRQLQLLIYCLALQNQKPLATDETKANSDEVEVIHNENTKNINSEIDNFEIAGAFLYDFNRLNRDKGFKVQELGSQLFSFDDQKRNKIDIYQKASFKK
jgi:ATP-dependent helicase/DNAse subunit B